MKSYSVENNSIKSIISHIPERNVTSIVLDKSVFPFLMMFLLDDLLA